jgi:anti-anti-sigma factor
MSIVTTTQAQGRVPVTILHLHDRINLGNAQVVEQAGRAAYDAGARYVIINLADAPSLSSAGLRAIMAIYQQFRSPEAAGSPLRLAEPSEHVRQVLTIAGLDRYIPVHASEADAVAAF